MFRLNRIVLFSFYRNVLGNHLEIPQKLGIKIEKQISMKDYIPYINNFADFPTILEAYQYLMKRYVMNARERHSMPGEL